jgi:hypothetical protein
MPPSIALHPTGARKTGERRRVSANALGRSQKNSMFRQAATFSVALLAAAQLGCEAGSSTLPAVKAPVNSASTAADSRGPNTQPIVAWEPVRAPKWLNPIITIRADGVEVESHAIHRVVRSCQPRGCELSWCAGLLALSPMAALFGRRPGFVADSQRPDGPELLYQLPDRLRAVRNDAPTIGPPHLVRRRQLRSYLRGHPTQ